MEYNIFHFHLSFFICDHFFRPKNGISELYKQYYKRRIWRMHLQLDASSEIHSCQMRPAENITHGSRRSWMHPRETHLAGWIHTDASMDSIPLLCITNFFNITHFANLQFKDLQKSSGNDSLWSFFDWRPSVLIDLHVVLICLHSEMSQLTKFRTHEANVSKWVKKSAKRMLFQID